MEEVKATAILDAYNRMFEPHISLEDVEDLLQTFAFINVSAEFAAKILHNSKSVEQLPKKAI